MGMGGRVGGHGRVMSAVVAVIVLVSIPAAGSHSVMLSSPLSFLALAAQREGEARRGVPRLLRLAGGAPWSSGSTTGPVQSPPTKKAAGQEQGGARVRARLGKMRATIGTWVSANVARVRRIRLTRQQAVA